MSAQAIRLESVKPAPVSVTMDVLQVEGVEGQETAETGSHHDRDRVRAGERWAAEEPQIDQRLGLSGFDDEQPGELTTTQNLR
ncbi:hypothetical protein [Amycolatopsis sp. NPDC059021]|uniref:hypothetical protein n=1 Tax=Amycolatopsis sp. NPDC059021 TaxID=3346704 RepID=UPI0036710B86